MKVGQKVRHPAFSYPLTVVKVLPPVSAPDRTIEHNGNVIRMKGYAIGEQVVVRNPKRLHGNVTVLVSELVNG